MSKTQTCETCETIDKNCLSYWFPKLESARIPVPRTRCITLNEDVERSIANHEDSATRQLANELKHSAESLSWPAFLRTGLFSGKHGWLNTCCVPSPARMEQHVHRLIEESQCADMIGLRTNVWVVREMLTPLSLFNAFDGFPVSREVRCFIDRGEVVCSHPYWPPDAIREPSSRNWRAELRLLNTLTGLGKERVRNLSERVADAFKGDGAWSVDLFYDSRSCAWFCTDMAIAERSFHWPGCPHNRWN